MLFKKHLFGDIRFYILLFFIVRLLGLTNPPLEVAHSWRQTDMMMVTRNMVNGDASLLYPAVDYAGSQLGVVGMEFPLFNYLNAKIIDVFGYAHWYGRLLNLFVCSVGTYLFYLLVSSFSRKKVAFYSAFVLLGGLWFGYSRKIIPDTFSASFMIAGMYGVVCFAKTFSKMRYAYLMLGCVGIAIAGLTKISSLAILSILAPAMLILDVRLKDKAIIAASTLAALLIVFFWYFVWVPHLNTMSPIRFFMGTTLGEGFWQVVADPWGIANRFVQTALGISGFAATLAGVYFAIKQHDKVFFAVAGFGWFAELLFLLKVGDHFAVHSYYIAHFVPVLAFMAGYAVANLPSRYVILFCVLLVSENIARLYSEFVVRSRNKSIEYVGDRLDELNVSANGLVAVNSNANPTVLYFTRRKGWLPSNEQLDDTLYLQSVINAGCECFIVDKRNGEPTMSPLLGRLVDEDERFKIFVRTAVKYD